MRSECEGVVRRRRVYESFQRPIGEGTPLLSSRLKHTKSDVMRKKERIHINEEKKCENVRERQDEGEAHRKGEIDEMTDVYV